MARARTEEPDKIAAYKIKVLDKAIDILEVFTTRQTDLGIPEIVQSTGLNRSTVIRIAANLERRGLLRKAADRGRYRLGHRLFEMGNAVYASLSLLNAAAEPLAALERRSAATIILAVRNGDYSVTVDKRQGAGEGFTLVPMPSEVGDVRPLTYGPVGQVLLATLTPEDIDGLLARYPLERYTPYSLVDHESFVARLPLVRSRAYAIEVNEVVEGLMGVAAPIVDFAGNTAGVLSLGFPSTRENDRSFVDAAVRDLRQTAAEISANLGCAAGGDEATAAEPAAS